MAEGRKGRIVYDSQGPLNEVGGGITEEEWRREQSAEVTPVHKRVKGKRGSGGVTRVPIADIAPEQGRVVLRRNGPGGGVVRGPRFHQRTGIPVGEGLAEVTVPRGKEVVIADDETKGGAGVVIDASQIDPTHTDRLGVKDPAIPSSQFAWLARRFPQGQEGGEATLSAVKGKMKKAKPKTSHWTQVGKNVLAAPGPRLKRPRQRRKKEEGGWEIKPGEEV